MDRFIIHSIPGSPYGRAALMALEEKSVPYRLVPVAPAQFGSKEHLARHPFAKVPVLEHGGFWLYETQAILRYIDRATPGPALIPADIKTQALMDQLLNVTDAYLFREVSGVICFQRIVGPALMRLAPDEGVIAATMPHAEAVIGILARTLGAQPYFTGDAFTLADLSLAAHLGFLAMTPEWATLAAPHENLRNWLARMNARPSMQATTWDKVREMAQAA
jgi:glutathione S-transferase